MEFHFLPAMAKPVCRWTPAGIASAQNIGKTRTKNPFQKLPCNNWMDEVLRGTPMYYPHMLISYYYFRNMAVQFPADGFIFGDSGGFSVLRYGMGRPEGVYLGNKNILKGSGAAAHQRRIDPVDVLHWQSKICTAGVLLDMPPVNLKGERIWRVACATTLQNTKLAVTLYEKLRRDNTPFRWWGVAHGWTEEHLDNWWGAVSKVYPFTDEGEGWAIRARPTSHDPVAVTRRLRWIQRRKITRAHFLAAASPAAMAAIIVLGPEAGLEFASCDSTVGTAQAKNRTLMLPTADGLGFKQLAETGDARNARDYLLKCPCGSCEQLRKDADAWPTVVGGKFNEYWTLRFVFHNMLTVFKLVATLEAEAKIDGHALLRAVMDSQPARGSARPTRGRVLRAFAGQEPMNQARYSKDSAQWETGIPRSILDWAK